MFIVFETIFIFASIEASFSLSSFLKIKAKKKQKQINLAQSIRNSLSFSTFIIHTASTMSIKILYRNLVLIISLFLLNELVFFEKKKKKIIAEK